MDIPLWGAPLVLLISPMSWGIDHELASVNGRNRLHRLV